MMTSFEEINPLALFDSLTGIDDGSEQYLIFTLGDESYAVDILRVQEIKGWERVTAIPNTPTHLQGVMNLRGEIVPVVDLRLLLGMPFQPHSNTTVVIVLKVNEAAPQRTVGMIVDAVADAQSIHPDTIQPLPDFGQEISTDSMLGMMSINQQLTIVLSVDRLLAIETLG